VCKETYHFLKRLDLKNIETQLALQCAPLFAGLKISNLLIVQKQHYERVDEILRGSGISYYLLMATQDKITLLLYKEDELKQFLSEKQVKAYFQKLEYKDFNIPTLLYQFQKRYKNYIETGRDFPHEMGLVLGYPIEDVNGFIENEGKNFLYSGYWKVYKNLPEKTHLFQRFDKAKKDVIQLIFNGHSIRDIITKDCDNNQLHVAS